MHSLGVTWPAGEISVAVSLGHAICTDRNAGNTPDAIATDVHNQLNGKGFTYQERDGHRQRRGIDLLPGIV